MPDTNPVLTSVPAAPAQPVKKPHVHRRMARALKNDTMKFRRWTRAVLGAFAIGGVPLAKQLEPILPPEYAWMPKAIMGASFVSGFIAFAINLGEKNDQKPIDVGAPGRSLDIAPQ